MTPPATNTLRGGVLARLMIAVVAFAALSAASLGAARGLQVMYAMRPAEEYMARAGDRATLVPAGGLNYDGVNFRCGRHPAILDTTLDDYGAAYFGFIVLNPARFETLSPILKRYAYAHECGHQYVGYDEGEADCHAIRRGKREGWLDAKGLEEICGFIGRSKGDDVHALGARRCEMMRRCFARARTGREPL